MRLRYLFLIAATLVISQSFAQSSFTLKGLVKDAKTGNVLPFATVFFAETTYGTTTNESGFYQLVVKNEGTYDLIVKFLGYKTFVAQIKLGETAVAEFDILIEADAKDLGSFVVTAKKDANWKYNMIEFRKIFLGESENARMCRILNEEVVDFIDDGMGGTLEAFSNEPIMIENEALGYKITYYLEKFVINYKTNLSTYYGYTIFEELESNNKRKNKKWESSRKKAYEGSSTHFFTSLYENKLKEEGFEVNAARDVEGLGRVLNPNDAKVYDSLKLGSSNISRELPFQNLLYITFNNEYESKVYQTSSRSVLGHASVSKVVPNKPQQSWIALMDGFESIEFEPSGYIYDPTAYYSAGYWGFEKVAEMVPINYRPKKED